MNMNQLAKSLGRNPLSDALHRNPGVVLNEQGPGRHSLNGALHLCPDVVINERGFPHFGGRVRVKKLVQQEKIRIGSWNIGTLTGKLRELVDGMGRRRVNILCLQETKWVGEKAREIEQTGYKLWYTGKDRTRNGVGIIVDKDLKDFVVDVKRTLDRIILVKLVLGEEIINIISTYAPQIGLDESIKREFWDNLDQVVQNIPRGEKLFIGGDLNGHVGKENVGFERVHGGFGFGVRNEIGVNILDFAVAYDLMLVNTFFRKRESHLVTFTSGHNKSQIDYFLTRREDRSICKDCKVIPGECITNQHKLVLLDIRIRKWKKRETRRKDPRIRWWNLKGDRLGAFKDKCIQEAPWDLDSSPNTMWSEMTNHIKRVAQEVLGESRGCGQSCKETWWWDESVQNAIRHKKECYKNLHKSKTSVNIEEYKVARNEAKKAVREAKGKAYEKVYEKLGTKEGEKDMYKIAKAREKKSRDLGQVRCVKDDNQNILVKEEDVKERWKDYFNKLYNNIETGEIDNLDSELGNLNRKFVRRIRIGEVKEALKRMKIGKALGPDDIPIEVWRCLGEVGLTWLTKLFNNIFQTNRMPDEWRSSTLIPIFKNKGDIQNCSNYRGIKLMSHTMKLWERVVEHRLRVETSVSENQFGFMPGRSTMEPIHLLRRLVTRYRDAKKDLHMVFIDLEKAYDRVPRRVLWWLLEKRGIPLKYISIIKDMYSGAVTSVRTVGGKSSDFPITVGVHQGSALSPFLFTLAMDELTKHIQDEVPWCMLFADDIVLVDETSDRLNSRLELWRSTLESKGFKLSRTKTEYMECRFSEGRRVRDSVIYLDGVVVPKRDTFRYLGSVMDKEGGIDEDVAHRIQAGWMKWRNASGVLCDRHIPTKLKGKFYRTAIRPAMLYGSECWAPKRQHSQKMSVAEMRMLRWMCGHTRKDRIRNEDIRRRVGVAPIEDKMRENRLRWFGHVQRRPLNAPVRKSDLVRLDEVKRGRGRPKLTWVDVIKKDMNEIGITEDMAFDRDEWRKLIHIADPN